MTGGVETLDDLNVCVLTTLSSVRRKCRHDPIGCIYNLLVNQCTAAAGLQLHVPIWSRPVSSPCRRPLSRASRVKGAILVNSSEGVDSLKGAPRIQQIAEEKAVRWRQ